MSKLTKNDLKKANIRSWMYPQFDYNYETMQSPGFTWSILPVLEKLYGHNPELLQKKIKKYMQFYNTNTVLNPVISGVCISLEESEDENITDTSIAMRTSLMGPLAGLGDSLIMVTGKTLFCSVAAYTAVEGNYFGLLVCILVFVALCFFKYFLFKVGYKQGVSFITMKVATLNNLTTCVCIIGVTVVGAMIPSMVSFTTNISLTMGEVTVTL